MLNLNTQKIPTNEKHKWEWIKYRLRSNDSNLSKLADQLNVSRARITQVRFIPSPKIEKIISNIIGVPAHIVWPDRYSNSTLKNQNVGTHAK